jgi:hypothetical protein
MSDVARRVDRASVKEPLLGTCTNRQRTDQAVRLALAEER